MRTGGPGAPLRAVAAAGAALVALLAPAGAGWAVDAAFTLPATPVGAPVGLATDPHRQLYWTTEGGGGPLRIHALRADGSLLGTTRSLDRTTDVQALAFSGGRVYVGDVGGRRREVTVWSMEDPVPTTLVREADRYRLVYPDGPHRSSAIFVDAGQRIHVVTLTPDGGAAIYAATSAPASSAEATPLRRVAAAPAGVEDATVLTDGRVALRGPGAVSLLDPQTYGVRDRLPAPSGEGSSVTVTLDGRGLLLAKEAAGSPVTRVAVPAAPAEPTPRCTVQPSVSASATAAPRPQPAVAWSPALTTALLGAAAVAALAGLTVLGKR